MGAQLSSSELARLEALRSYCVLDTEPEDSFDGLVELAADLFDAPIALVSLVDESRQWFKAKVGLTDASTPRSISFCARAIAAADQPCLVVEDASRDPRFSENPLVTGELGIRFYAGAVLVNPQGFRLGTLCVIDRKPRARPTERELARLQRLASLVVDELELRKAQRSAQASTDELRQAHADLKEREENYRHSVELSSQASWITDENWKLLQISPRWDEIVGVEADVLFSSDWASVVHPDDVAHVAAYRARLQALNEPGITEYRALQPDGSYQWRRAWAAPRLNAGGSVFRWHGAIEDIHSRKVAEAALEESRRLFVDMAADAPAMIWTTDETGAATFLNKRWCETTGQTLEEALGSGWLDALHPDDRSEVQATFKAAVACSGIHRSEFRLRAASGEWLWVIDTARPQLDETGRLRGYVGSVLDITERRQAEAETARTTERLLEVLESTTDSVIALGDQDKITYINGRAQQMLGLSSAALGQGLFDIYPEEADGEFSKAYAHARATNQPVSFEAYLSSLEQWLEVHAYPTSGGLWIFFRDVTQRRNVQDALLKAKRRAEAMSLKMRLVASKATQERRRAEAANAAKEQFLANMSHELRTPLNGILAIAELLKLQSGDKDVSGKAELIASSARDLGRIVSDILDHAKHNAGDFALESAPFSPAQAVRAVCEELRPAAEEKGLVLECDIDSPAHDPVLGDAARVRQIVRNLVSNATKFTDRGRIRVSISASGESDAERHLTLRVEDTGVGFAPEHAERIFEPFEQADASTTRQYGGTGLGLAIVRGLARRMGGDVSARSVPQKGSVFEVDLRLPGAAPATLPAAEEEHGPADPGERPLKILCAEDNPTNREVVRLLLEPLGVSPHFVEDGEAALGALAAETYDLVLMDMQMPIMGGLEAVAKFRSRETEAGKARTPVVMLTANTSEDHVAASLAAGADLHLAKPLAPIALYQAIEQMLAQATA